MTVDFWAKSSGVTLEEHTRHVLEAVEALCAKFGSSYKKEWWTALRYAALLHDLGKVDPAFQEKLMGSGDGGEREIPHSLLSLFLFRPEELKFSDPSLGRAVVSAVAFHHWRESFPEILMGHRAGEIGEKAAAFISSRQKWDQRCREVINKLSGVVTLYKLDQKVLGINENLVEYLRYHDLGSAGFLVPPYTLIFLPSKMRSNFYIPEEEKLRIFITGNLMRADHFASLAESSGGTLSPRDVEDGPAPGYNDIAESLGSRFGSGEFWQKEFFDARPGLRGENMIFVAPAGTGKTEFAYLWGAGRKNLLILPMRSAVNKIYDRTVEVFGCGRVSLLHGDAALELFIRSGDRGGWEEEGERRKAIDLARHLTKPCVVATADQIAPAALKYPGYERILAVLMNGALVIDEVQAYDPQAAAIITHLIQQNSALGGKTLLMTATLPPFIGEEIKKRAAVKDDSTVNLLDQPGFKEIAESVRHRVQFLTCSENYQEALELILNEARSGKKVLVIMNTVSAAREVYGRIKEALSQQHTPAETALLHARFTPFRRGELEQKVVEELMPNKPGRDGAACVVVSTQLVEASLDLDADVLFTEPAPADSLVQRMGRVFRRYARSEGNNAPEKANVFIVLRAGGQAAAQVPKKGGRKAKNKGVGGAPLSSGIGTVYDRDLTALSLAVLAEAFTAANIWGDSSPLLENKTWQKCFRKKKGKGAKKAGETLFELNETLVGVIEKLTAQKTVLLSERDKMRWVEQTYTLLKMGRNPESALNLGNYLNRYYDTLEILEHGYCSDRKRDAQRLFREVSDITGVPSGMVEQFYQEVRQWVGRSAPSLNYLELAVEILPRYTVSCPYRSAAPEGKTPAGLQIEAVIPKDLDPNIRRAISKKLELWLSDLVVLDLPYDDEKGLDYFDS